MYLCSDYNSEEDTEGKRLEQRGEHVKGKDYSRTAWWTHKGKRLEQRALQRKLHIYIPLLGIARPQYQFPHLCVYERFIYSQDQSTYFLQQNRQTDPGNI